MRMTGKPFPGWPHLACPALLAAAPLLCLYANPYPDILMRDQWRMAPLVVDYHTGNLRLTDIFIPHYDVSIVFYKALFLLNGIVLKLNMPAEFFLGLFLFFLYTCVFFFSVRQAGNNSKHTILMLAMVLVIMYSQAQSMLWHSSLIMVSFGMLLLLSVLAITFFDKFIRDGGMPRHAFLSLLCIALLVLGETTASLITLTAIIFLLAIHWITTKSLRKKIFIYSIAIVLLYTVAIALQILYSFSMLKSPHEYAFMAPISNFTQRLSYVINLFGASLYIYKTIESLPKWVVFASGATLIGLYFFAIISFVRHRENGDSSLPLFLILFSFAFALALIIGRSGTDFSSPFATRYVHASRVGLAGLAWIAGSAVLRLPRPLLRKSLAAACLFLLMGLEGANMYQMKIYNAAWYPFMERQKRMLLAQRYERVAKISPVRGIHLVERADKDFRKLGLGMYRNGVVPGNASPAPARK